MDMNLKTMITKMQIALFKVKTKRKADPYKIEQDSTLLKFSLTLQKIIVLPLQQIYMNIVLVGKIYPIH